MKAESLSYDFEELSELNFGRITDFDFVGNSAQERLFTQMLRSKIGCKDE